MDFNNENETYVDAGKLSKINSAYLVNSTLNNIWIDFFRHFRAGQYLSSNNDLDCVWTILGGEKGISESKEEKEFVNIQADLKALGDLINGANTKGFAPLNQIQLAVMNKQRDVILKKSLFLRRLQNSQGKGTAYHDENEEDFE